MANDVKWIKITTDIFDNWKIKTIKAMPEGHKMICIWVQLLCIAGARNEHGMIIFPTQMCTTDDVLATVIGEDKLVVSMALEVFSKLGMIMVDDDNSIIQISNWEEYQSVAKLDEIKEYERQRKQKYRDKQKQLPKNDCPENVPDMSMDSSYSYSFSNSYTNIRNFNILINDKEYEFIKNNSSLLEVVSAFMEYKDNKTPKKDNHYLERGMRSLLKRISKNAIEYGVDVIVDLIDETMSNNWKGIVWEKLEKLPKKKANKLLPFEPEEVEEEMSDEEWEEMMRGE